jgi:hypothetical protein
MTAPRVPRVGRVRQEDCQVNKILTNDHIEKEKKREKEEASKRLEIVRVLPFGLDKANEFVELLPAK